MTIEKSKLKRIKNDLNQPICMSHSYDKVITLESDLICNITDNKYDDKA